MNDAPAADASPKLVELLRVLVTLFPEHYSNTRSWLTQSANAHRGDEVSKQSEAPPGTIDATQTAVASRTNRPPNGEKRKKWSRPQDQGGSPGGPPSQQPSHFACPQPPKWPSVPPEVHRVPKALVPAEWATAQGYGLRLVEWHEEQELKSAFASKLGFPRAGTMGRLIRFDDSWPAAGGQTSISVYHPRENNPKLVLIDITRDSELVAQFEVPTRFISAASIVQLLPVDWRKGG